MIFDSLLISKCFMVLFFLSYTFLLLKLTDTILEEPRFKSVCRFIIIGINALFGYIATMCSYTSSSIVYIIFPILLFVELYIFYKDKLPKILFCTQSCILHLIAIRSICVAACSLATGESIYYIANNLPLLIISTCASFLVTDIAIVVIMKFIPAKNIKIINNHPVHLWFLIAWMTVFNIYLYYNAKVYSIPLDHPSLTLNQMLAPIAILIGLYIMFFFSIKTSILLGYKEKNKQLQQEISSEQQYRESIIKNSIMTYEFNLTNNTVIKGCELYIEELKNHNNDSSANTFSNISYSDMLVYVIQKFIHPDDIGDIIQKFMPQNMLIDFEHGKSETILEYRRFMPSGEYKWARSVSNLVRDVKTNEVKGFTYIKDIDNEKRHQIELQNKAERDSLTKLYNKGTTEMIISEILLSEHVKSGALFIIDVDNFKSINDHFGHIYGDAVLCEISEKLSDAFLNDGVVGRIGGDEFIAFMKNPKSINAIEERARNVCSAFHKTYKGDMGIDCIVSSSIGIALFPEDGLTFEELYINSDIALYAVKNAGKNSYKLYDSNSFLEYESNRTEIDAKGTSIQKSFKENRIEYIFKILYDSDSSITSIHAVLELIASHFGFDRGYIFETGANGTTTSNTFEWCKEDITSEINNLQNVPIELVKTANESFYATGMFTLSSIDMLAPDEREILESQGIKSMFQFGLFDHDKLLGFIGFDNCSAYGNTNDDEIAEMMTICNILATFFVKQRLVEHSAKSITALTALMDNLDSFTYVVEKDTFKILFMNEKTAKLVGRHHENVCCYLHFRGYHKPCTDCPIMGLDPYDEKSRCIKEIHNKKFNLWTETTASYINWIDGEKACLINCTDITKYKNI